MNGEEARMFLYFSELLGRSVRTAEGTRLGRASDIKVRLGELYPKAATLVVRRRADKEIGRAHV